MVLCGSTEAASVMRLRSLTTVVALFSSAFVSSQDSYPLSEDPTAFYSMIELVCIEGYYIQEHKVLTDDGYILKIYRIPSGKRRPKTPKRRNHFQHLHEDYHPDFADCVNDSLHEASVGPPVLLSHGLGGASDVWVLQGANFDLAFLLADRDYDVWFSNIRGNFYSRRHKTLKPSDPSFWDFSFLENGAYDMPATIDRILSVTGAPKLTYIGHSMGTTMFFVMVSERPEYKERVQLFVGITPVGQIMRRNFSQARLNVFNTVVKLLEALERLGVKEFIPRNYLSSVLFRALCWRGSPLQDLCYDLTFFFSGFHSKLFLRKNLLSYCAHALGGSSIKTFHHFEQLLDAKGFQQFDYGPEENFRRYGQAEPPEYNLWNMTVPAALYYSRGDYIADIKDVTILKGLLPNVIEENELPHYSHLDYLWAYNAKDLVYTKVVDVVDKYRIREEGRTDSSRME